MVIFLFLFIIGCVMCHYEELLERSKRENQ